MFTRLNTLRSPRSSITVMVFVAAFVVCSCGSNSKRPNDSSSAAGATWWQVEGKSVAQEMCRCSDFACLRTAKIRARALRAKLEREFTDNHDGFEKAWRTIEREFIVKRDKGGKATHSCIQRVHKRVARYALNILAQCKRCRDEACASRLGTRFGKAYAAVGEEPLGLFVPDSDDTFIPALRACMTKHSSFAAAGQKAGFRLNF